MEIWGFDFGGERAGDLGSNFLGDIFFLFTLKKLGKVLREFC